MDQEITKNEANEAQDENQEVEQITMTKEELEKLIQVEGDKRVTGAKKKFEAEYHEKVKKREEEAKRLAQLSAEERAAEIQRQKDEEVAFLKKEINRRDLEADTISRLNDEGIDIDFKDFLMAEDVETTNQRIKLFKTRYELAIQKAVEERLVGSTPKKETNTFSFKEKIDVKNYAEEKRIIK